MNRKQRRAAAKLGSPVSPLLATAVRLHQAGQLGAAEACYRQVLAAQPNLAEAHSNLGNALAAQGKLGEAVAAHREAISIKPDYAEAHSNLGDALTTQGKLDEAIAAYRQAISIKPDYAKAFSSLLLGLNYDDRSTNDQLFAAHREWDERYGQRAPRFTVYPNDRDPARRLRIGYFSPDFRQH